MGVESDGLMNYLCEMALCLKPKFDAEKSPKETVCALLVDGESVRHPGTPLPVGCPWAGNKLWGKGL